ncbi:MAG: YkgJ family cysteine cluster protein [Rhodospirillaceae bacterium]|nr:YkgJ family cysteine cluster protein [Rhodospirillaceae bacterium]
MERHFACTACGKCCEGWLPLSIDDALAHAERFPLFLLWTPVRAGGKSYDLTAQLGFQLKLKNRKQAAVRITPVSYVPTNMACPALEPGGLCGVQENKPQRCRTMPLSASRAQSDQADLLIPKAGWLCDTSDTATLVYRDNKIVAGEDFQAEREQLLSDAEILRPFGQLMLDSQPSLRTQLQKIALRPHGGHLIINFSSLIPRLAKIDIYDFAAKQLAVMIDFADRTAGKAEFSDEHKRYQSCGADLQRIVDGAP